MKKKSLFFLKVVHGDGITQLKHWADSGLPSQVTHFEKDFEYRWDYQYSGGLLTEERFVCSLLKYLS